MSMFTVWAARTHTGLVRGKNEDSGYAGDWLFAVADGMGGHVGGEIASSTVITSLSQHDVQVPARQLASTLGAAVQEANVAIRQRTDANPALRTMSTTLTAMLWSGYAFALAHAGDSRAYLLRGGELTRLTEDHAMQNLVSGVPDAVAPVMTRYLDGRPDRSPDLMYSTAAPGDRYLLCSDGLSSVVPLPAIRDFLADGGAGDVAEHLVNSAIGGGGPDNITVIVIDVITEPAVSGACPEVIGAARVLDGERPCYGVVK
jgi:PPM family protein phosphatase